MWMIRWFLLVIVIIGIAVFIGLNGTDQQEVKLNYLFGEKVMTPLTLMFFSFVAGFLIWFVISLFNFLKMRSELSARDKVIKNLKEELNDYRNESLALEDADKTVVMKKESTAPSSQPPLSGDA